MTTRETDTDLHAANEADIQSWHDFLDLSVPLTIELGRTRLSLRAILDLEALGIIQLSRSTGEGVDIQTDDRLLGRGEIIMIEDRTGIRVNEVHLKEN